MTSRLGVVVGQGELRAVLTRKRCIVWHARVAIDGSYSSAAESLLSSLPARRWRKPVARIAMGAAHATVKSIEGLPSRSGALGMNAIVKENADAFFLRSGPRLVVADVDRRQDGVVLGAAFDGALLDDLIASLRARGIERVTVVALASALAPSLANGLHRMIEDGIATELGIANGRIVSVRRAPTSDDPVSSPLRSNAEIPIDLVAPYVVATTAENLPLAWRPAPPAADVRRRAWARTALSSIALAVSIAAAAVAPGVRAWLISRQAVSQLRDSEMIRSEAARLDGQLRRTSMELEQAAHFGATRGQATLLLGDLAQSLPESTAVLSIRVDSAEISLVALALHAADVISQLSTVNGVANPRVAGSVTREVQGGAHLERATFRLQRRRFRP